MSEANGQQLPKGWVATSLGAIQFDLATGVKPARRPDEMFELCSVPSHEKGVPETVCGRAIGSNKQTVVPNTVLLCKINPRINRVWVVETESKHSTIASTEWIPFFPVPGLEPRYLAYFLRQNTVRDFLAHNASGVGGSLMRVRAATFRDFRFVIAPSTEQERIADALDELLSDLDAGVAALERVQAKLKHYRAAVLKAAVEGALTAEWRAQHPATEPASALLTRILAERRRRWEEAQLQKFKEAGKAPPKNWKAKYQEPAGPDTTNLPLLPTSWRWVRLEELLCEIEAGKSFTCVPRRADLGEWGIIKVSAMSWGFFDENENKTVPSTRKIDPYYEIKNGDILLSRANTYELVGASVLVKSCRPRLLLSDKSMRLLHGPSVDKVWLQTMLGSPWVRRQLSTKSTGTKEGMRNVSQGSVLDVVIPLAPAAECLELVETVEDQLSVIEHLEADLDAKLKSAQALRQSILRHAFTGQLVPQDPKDEPAAELLTRIAAQREELARQAQAAKKTKPKAPPKRAVKQTKEEALS